MKATPAEDVSRVCVQDSWRSREVELDREKMSKEQEDGRGHREVVLSWHERAEEV